MKAFFLTAGFATRFRPHSDKIPKPLIPFWGAPLITYSYEWVKEFSVDTAIFNLHHLKEKTKTGILSTIQDSNIIFSEEEPQILGSGGAILHARKFLTEESFFVCNGDEVFFPKNKEYLNAKKQHDEEGLISTLFAMEHPEAGKTFGALWVDKDGYVKEIGKSSSDPSLKAYHYIGMSIFSPEIFDKQETRECNILYDLLKPHLMNQRAKIFKIDCDWYEMGNEKSFIQAHMDMAHRWDEFSRNEHFLKVSSKYSPKYQIKQNEKSFIASTVDVLNEQCEGFVLLNHPIAENVFIKDSIIYGESSVTKINNQLIL